MQVKPTGEYIRELREASKSRVYFSASNYDGYNINAESLCDIVARLEAYEAALRHAEKECEQEFFRSAWATITSVLNEHDPSRAKGDA